MGTFTNWIISIATGLQYVFFLAEALISLIIMVGCKVEININLFLF